MYESVLCSRLLISDAGNVMPSNMIWRNDATKKENLISNWLDSVWLVYRSNSPSFSFSKIAYLRWMLSFNANASDGLYCYDCCYCCVRACVCACVLSIFRKLKTQCDDCEHRTTAKRSKSVKNAISTPQPFNMIAHLLLSCLSHNTRNIYRCRIARKRIEIRWWMSRHIHTLREMYKCRIGSSYIWNDVLRMHSTWYASATAFRIWRA